MQVTAQCNHNFNNYYLFCLLLYVTVSGKTNTIAPIYNLHF